MSVQFPYSKKTPHCPDEHFIAAWKIFALRFGPEGADPATVKLPVGSLKEKLEVLLGGWRRFSLDVLCRLLVDDRNTMQAAPRFRSLNNHLIEEINVGRRDEVRLTERGRSLLMDITEDDLRSASAIFDADLEDDSDGLVNGQIVETVSLPAAPTHTPQRNFETVPEAIEALVNWVEKDPFKLFYRGRPVLGTTGETRVFGGWLARLQCYFWPTPTVGIAQTQALIAPIVQRAGPLYAALNRSWTPREQQDAVAFANDVFRWGGVPQRNVQASVVRQVFESVDRKQRSGEAPMNSGWTKVAAFASEHASPGRETVIWDSRVAHSLIRRLDVLLSPTLRGMHPFSGIGYVPGRGGTRIGTPTYMTRWQNGYGRWDVQFAGSDLVRLIRDEVNRQQRLGHVSGGRGAWTMREVEMVLFMDGY